LDIDADESKKTVLKNFKLTLNLKKSDPADEKASSAQKDVPLKSISHGLS